MAPTPPAPQPKQRNLTDADVEAIVAKGEEVILSRFYRNLGMGLWGIIWKALVVGLIGLAAYGSMTGKR
jgi:hypothetical protein